jgi:hypothetical protein
VGVKETGSNSGKEVNEYLRSVGLSPGNSWCAAFQYWGFFSACVELNLNSSHIPIQRTGLALNVIKYVMKMKSHNTPFRAKPGDLIVWQHGNTIHGHIGCIIVVHGLMVTTIEGNTGPAAGSQSNGDGVYEKRRSLLGNIGDMKAVALIGFLEIINNYEYNTGANSHAQK